MPPPSNPQLDHIILLLPHSVLLNPPSVLTSAFTLLPGGRHADGLTENKLIVLQDGCYIELISFINDDVEHRAPGRDGHWWGSKDWGVIDWALTLQPSSTSSSPTSNEENASDLKSQFKTIQFHVSSQTEAAVKYADPVPGGRTKPDGTDIKWAVAFPENGKSRGEVPFWCLDMTPRNLRVPVNGNEDAGENAKHACGAVGVAAIDILVPRGRARELKGIYESVFGGQAKVTHRGSDEDDDGGNEDEPSAGGREVGWGWECDVPISREEEGRNVSVTLWEEEGIEDVVLELTLETQEKDSEDVKFSIGGKDVNIGLTSMGSY